MEQSILTSTKKILGIEYSYTVFDLDILTHINASFSILTQLGLGPTTGFFIEDENTTWDEFMAPGVELSLVRTYIFLKVRMLFDPPTTSFLIGAYTDQIEEYEWRLAAMNESVV